MKSGFMTSCAVGAILAGCGGAAFAADTGSSSTGTDASSGGIEQIVVTASRRSESLQNVPTTIQAFSGQTLKDLGVATLDDVLKYTPNVTYGNNGPGQGDIFLRGLSNGFRGDQSTGTVGQFPNVAIYLDDQSMQFPARNVDIYMVDMERIEVLEGPQGTLFGGSAEAGAIRYITNKPVLDETSGNFQATYGATSGGGPNSAVNAVLNLPVIDNKLAVRLVVYDEQQGGYIDNVPSDFSRSNSDLGNSYWNILPTGGICPNGLPPSKGQPPNYPAGICAPANSGPINNAGVAGKDFNPVTYSGMRASMLYKVDNDWDVLVAESFQNLDAEGLSVEYPYSSQISPNNTLTPLGALQVTSFSPSYERDALVNTAWTVNGKIDFLKVVYTGGYTVRHIKQQMDYTNYSRSKGGMYYQCVGGSTGWGSSNPAITPPYCYSPASYWDDTVSNTHISNEIRLSTPDDWRFRAIAGGYQEKFQIDDVMNYNNKTLPACTEFDIINNIFCVGNVETLPGTTANDPGVRGDSTAFGEDTQRGYSQVAAFGSVDFDVIPQVLTLSAGTRWYQYSEFEVGSEYLTGNNCAQVLVCDDGININGNNDHKVYTGHKSRGNITWHVTPDTMAYFLYSEGFRPGGFNRGPGDVLDFAHKADPQYDKPNSYAPDSLVNYEVGAKSEFFDNRLQLNMSAYAMHWSSVQFLLFDPPFTGNTTFGLNGPNYDIKGVELQAVAEVWDGLTLQGSGSYNQNIEGKAPCLVDNIPGSGGAGFGNCITEAVPKGGTTPVPFPSPFGTVGSQAAFSPKFEGNLRARYDWIMNDYNSYVQVGASFMGKMYNQPANYPSGNGLLIPYTTYLRYEQPSYTTFDAALGVAKGNWEARIFGENLTDTHASTFTSSAQFIESEVPLRPRIYGLSLGYKF
ncbi:MAG: TonB-dependent receptor [Rhizomicrobium sp.]